jgi:hypothetical protein
VGSEVDDVAWLERRHEELIDVGAGTFAVDGSVKQAGGIDAVIAPGGEESRGLPTSGKTLDPIDISAFARIRFSVTVNPGGYCLDDFSLDLHALSPAPMM